VSEFDQAVALGGDADLRTAVLGEGWLIGGAINGGLLMALGARAMTEAVTAAGGGADALAFSAYFLSASQPGPVQLTPEVLRVGRALSTAGVSLSQDGHERVRMLGTVGDLGAMSEPVNRQQPAPALPGPDQCIPLSMGPPEIVSTIKIIDRLDARLDPATAGFGMGQPSGEGELRGWIRFADGREPDALALPCLLDAFPPVAFDLGVLGWAPTIEFSGHLRARPAPGWLRIRLTTTNVSGGLLEEDCVIWDSTDRVVAQSRQLAGIRMPSGPVA